VLLLLLKITGAHPSNNERFVMKQVWLIVIFGAFILQGVLFFIGYYEENVRKMILHGVTAIIMQNAMNLEILRLDKTKTKVSY